jgi:hypothetical protein
LLAEITALERHLFQAKATLQDVNKARQIGKKIDGCPRRSVQVEDSFMELFPVHFGFRQAADKSAIDGRSCGENSNPDAPWQSRLEPR